VGLPHRTFQTNLAHLWDPGKRFFSWKTFSWKQNNIPYYILCMVGCCCCYGCIRGGESSKKRVVGGKQNAHNKTTTPKKEKQKSKSFLPSLVYGSVFVGSDRAHKDVNEKQAKKQTFCFASFMFGRFFVGSGSHSQKRKHKNASKKQANSSLDFGVLEYFFVGVVRVGAASFGLLSAHTFNKRTRTKKQVSTFVFFFFGLIFVLQRLRDFLFFFRGFLPPQKVLIHFIVLGTKSPNKKHIVHNIALGESWTWQRRQKNNFVFLLYKCVICARSPKIALE